MKKLIQLLIFIFSAALFGCSDQSSRQTSAAAENNPAPRGQESVNDNDSQKDVVKIAAASADHTTLVAALKQADYITELSNAGPFTVFAPTNAAFDKLPKGTVSDLMKSENKDKLRDLLEYHVSVGGYRQEMLTDGQTINQANLKNITISLKDGKMRVNNSANVIGVIPASNGIIYVIDEVLLPPPGK